MIECIGCGGFNVYVDGDGEDATCYFCRDCAEVWCEDYEAEGEELHVGDWNWTERPRTTDYFQPLEPAEIYEMCFRCGGPCDGNGACLNRDCSESALFGLPDLNQ